MNSKINLKTFLSFLELLSIVLHDTFIMRNLYLAVLQLGFHAYKLETVNYHEEYDVMQAVSGLPENALSSTVGESSANDRSISQ